MSISLHYAYLNTFTQDRINLWFWASFIGYRVGVRLLRWCDWPEWHN